MGAPGLVLFLVSFVFNLFWFDCIGLQCATVILPGTFNLSFLFYFNEILSKPKISVKCTRKKILTKESNRIVSNLYIMSNTCFRKKNSVSNGYYFFVMNDTALQIH